MNKPLAERMRPQSLEDYFGQNHLVWKQWALTKNIQKWIIPSIIFWWPPWTWKTTLANIIAKESWREFYSLSAINSWVKKLREVIEMAEKSNNLFASKNPILFIDEIHRFSKSQQDSLLWAVEKWIVTLIWATTENPSFEVVSALLSRCQVYIINDFWKDDLLNLLQNAIKKDEIISEYDIELKETEALLRISWWDGRKLLNTFELLVMWEKDEKIVITDEMVLNKVQRNSFLYDKSWEQHYDIISAFIKSIRWSDPNWAVYWLARMMEWWENVKFIARRMLILASEDIWNANPTALVMANNTFQAVNVIWAPESRIILSQCAIYLANSEKSNASYEAINKAQQFVRKTWNLSVPVHLRNAPTKLMKDLNYWKDYKYSHAYKNNFVKQEFLPSKLKNTKFYEPWENIRENAFRKILKERWGGKYGY